MKPVTGTRKLVKRYTNGELTVVWQPDLCIHSTVCFRGLPQVFDPSKRPWVAIGAEPTQVIRDQVGRCPSGALTAFMNGDVPESAAADNEVKVEVTPNGPLLVHGNLVVRTAGGGETHKSQVTAFCRCGQSKNKPFCDGSHVGARFQG